MNLKPHFSRFLDGARWLHAAAHSHHPWPDVAFDAHQQAWLDAATWHDDKWDRVFDEVLPEAQSHVARRLNLPDPASLAFAPNTHELVARVVSCLPRPARVLTSDGEFHSFARQLRRWEESGRAIVQRVPSQPFPSFPERFAHAAGAGGHDLVYCSQVLFDSGYAVPDLDALVGAVPEAQTYVVIDGYHGFMALPTDFGSLASRAFYTAGGYKYAMAGEGACFLHCPLGYGERPEDTGWFAGFGTLVQRPGDSVGYPADGGRFLGATFDPTPLYRFNAVQRWLDGLGVTVEDIHRHVAGLQASLLEQIDGALPLVEADPRGHFICFVSPEAARLHAGLRDLGVLTDYRGDRLRVGLGVYHDAADVETIAGALRKVAG